MAKPARTYTTRQVADLLGVKPATIRAYHYRKQMPEPAGTTELGGPVWDAEVIDAWNIRRNQPRRKV